MTSKAPNNAHHGGIITATKSGSGESSDPNVQALKDLLQKEEKRLSMLKTIHDLQDAVVVNSKTSIQGSALNKKGSHSSAAGAAVGGGGGGGTSGIALRQTKPKHSIVVVPGHQTKNTSSIAIGPTGISSRLQKLVKGLGASGRDASTETVSKVVNVATPPVPSLTSILPSTHSQKHTTAYHVSSGTKATPSANTGTPQIRPAVNPTSIRSSHEVITISDSPISKTPPPLLSSTAKMHVTTNGLVQVPTISSTAVPSTTASISNGDKVYVLPAEHSRRYRDYLVKQNMAKKNFQKQIERKMVMAAYPKTFRQVWPLIPVYDSAFVRNYGLESVSHHFDPSSNSAQDKNIYKVKPICNQCGCDFASAWQIRKSNSKQLLLCEACDFQNLKILQRSKLGNQLKELMECIKKEEGKFGSECEEARKQVLLLEKRAAENPPPPLTSNKVNTYMVQTKGGGAMDKQVSVRGQSNVASTVSGLRKQLNQQILVGSNSTVPSRNILPMSTVSASTASTSGHQKSYSTVVLKEPVVVGVKRKEPPGDSGIAAGQINTPPPNKVCKPGSVLDVTLNRLSQQSPGGGGVATGQVNTPPPSKVCKPGSVLDVTLNRLSQQLLTRKLDEKRIISKDAGPVGGSVETERVPVREGTTGVAKQDCIVACVAEVNVANHRSAGNNSATPGPGGAGNNSSTPGPGGAGNISATPGSGSTVEKTKSRRKGTPKHRLCSASD